MSKKKLPKDLTIPLTFTHIGGKYGEWKFNVPVQQIPVKKIESNTITSSKDGAYTFKMESVIRGEAQQLLTIKRLYLSLRVRIYLILT
ncbi:hypothetical protein [Paenisporosarcina sp. OV554]|uniref:hypothetical protein n=1 Tax=Paenisporosarcina sp. OV554 TaxID=2135694 RepID=UPI000D3B9D41|nr:hypothetical protein [Paenisporosarcina sp. OV554]PUB09500.1 hypothetical protein C8K15_1292 [Paenisporosarcina sp. OV554]